MHSTQRYSNISRYLSLDRADSLGSEESHTVCTRNSIESLHGLRVVQLVDGRRKWKALEEECSGRPCCLVCNKLYSGGALLFTICECDSVTDS